MPLADCQFLFLKPLTRPAVQVGAIDDVRYTASSLIHCRTAPGGPESTLLRSLESIKGARSALNTTAPQSPELDMDFLVPGKREEFIHPNTLVGLVEP